jgi:hypothetical protein
METKEKIKKTIEFFREAFQVDGKVRIITDDERRGFKLGAIVEMQDSKRGTFYLAQVTK